MAVKEHSYPDGNSSEVLSNPPPFTPLDEDIINLFSSPSETDLGEESEHETQFMQQEVYRIV